MYVAPHFSDTFKSKFATTCQYILTLIRDTVDQILLVSTTQVVMGTALVLGLVATLVLLFKLCATTRLR